MVRVKKDKIKIVTIGGGSSYTPELIEGYIKRKDELPIKEIWLVDIEEGKEKLEIVGALAKRMVEKAGLDWEVHLTLDRRLALKDADFVSTQFRVGLLDARIKDERIPLSHGVIGQETNGAGGMFKAFRTVPVILDIVKDMKELCPDAWLVNFTNPAGMVTEAVLKYGNFEKVVGLCNVPIGHTSSESKLLGVEQSDLFFHYAGLNHHHWHRVFDKFGNEVTKTIIEKMYEEGTTKDMENIHQLPFFKEQVEDLEMLPCGYHRYYYLTDDMLKHQLEEYAKGETRAEVVKRTEAELFELYKDPNLAVKPPQLEKRGDKGKTPYNLRNCAYLEEFQKEKIFWAEMTKEACFNFDDENFFINQTCYFSTDLTKYHLAILNSKLVYFYFSNISNNLGEGAFRWIKQFVEQIPIPKIEQNRQKPFKILVDYIIYLKKEKKENYIIEFFERVIDIAVYELYFKEELHLKGFGILEVLESELIPFDNSFETIERVYKKLSDKNHKVAYNVNFIDTLDIVKTIENK